MKKRRWIRLEPHRRPAHELTISVMEGRRVRGIEGVFVEAERAGAVCRGAVPQECRRRPVLSPIRRPKLLQERPDVTGEVPEDEAVVRECGESEVAVRAHGRVCRLGWIPLLPQQQGGS